MSLNHVLTVSLTSLALVVGAGAVVGASEAPPPTAAAGLRLVVDVSERQLYAYEGDELLHSYPVAVGKKGHPTPRGDFRIRKVIWNPKWVPPDAEWAEGKKATGPGDPDNPMGKVKMFFQPPDYYIHGTDDTDSLGRAASHGCVRMRNSDVVRLAQLVMEHGGEPREPSWVERILNKVRSTHTVGLRQPVPIEIRS